MVRQDWQAAVSYDCGENNIDPGSGRAPMMMPVKTKYSRHLGTAAVVLAVIAFSVFVFGANPAAAAKYAAIVIDAETGSVLHKSSADEHRHPASLTKMMTLYLVFEALESGELRLDQRITVSRRASRMPRSRLGLRRGKTISVEQAILALVTKSANDVATAVAEHLAGTEAKFARRMTLKARALGMRRTTFRNASGLFNRGQLTTARDFATLGLALLRDHPKNYHYFSRKNFVYRGRSLRNHNKLLRKYNGTDGIKTGYIRAAGFNLVASAVRNNRRLIGVVMGGRTGWRRDRQMMRLLDKAFAVAGPGPAEPKIAGTSPSKPAAEPKGETVVTPRFASPATFEPNPSRRADLGPQLASLPRVTIVRPVSRETARSPLRPKPRKSGRSWNIDTAVDKYADTPLTFEDGSQEEQAAGEWGIQVGAFREPEAAQRAAANAQDAAPNLLRDTNVAVIPIESELGSFYRARIYGISPDQAERACKTLSQRNMPCVAMEISEADCDSGEGDVSSC